MGTITGVCSCVFVETVVGESVVVIKKLLQMQVWVLSSIVNCVLSLPCSFLFVLVSVLGALDVSDAQKLLLVLKKVYMSPPAKSENATELAH